MLTSVITLKNGVCFLGYSVTWNKLVFMWLALSPRDLLPCSCSVIFYILCSHVCLCEGEKQDYLGPYTTGIYTYVCLSIVRLFLPSFKSYFTVFVFIFQQGSHLLSSHEESKANNGQRGEQDRIKMLTKIQHPMSSLPINVDSQK